MARDSKETEHKSDADVKSIHPLLRVLKKKVPRSQGRDADRDQNSRKLLHPVVRKSAGTEIGEDPGKSSGASVDVTDELVPSKLRDNILLLKHPFDQACAFNATTHAVA